MMINQFSRTEMLLGSEAMEKLFSARVAVFGIGGVGGYVLEALVRSGIGAVDIIDCDKVSLTNLNRQIIATYDTLDMYKTDAAEARINQINPDCKVTKHTVFYTPETAGRFDFSEYDYVIDAIDTVTGKIELVMNAERCCAPIISSMGAGNKLNPAMLEVSDIYKTSVCPLAKVMRYELRRRGIKHLKVVYSKEPPMSPSLASGTEESGGASRIAAGSSAFVPPAAGLIIASEVIKDITGIKNA